MRLFISICSVFLRGGNFLIQVEFFILLIIKNINIECGIFSNPGLDVILDLTDAISCIQLQPNFFIVTGHSLRHDYKTNHSGTIWLFLMLF